MISAPELVQLVMKLTGTETPTQLARSLRMTGYSAPRKITRWLNGDSSPDFENTLALLAAAGMLNLDAAPVAASDVDPTLRAVQGVDRRLDTDIIPRLDRLDEAMRQADRERSSS